MKFPLPKKYSAPEGVKDGEEFKDIATFKINGKEMELCCVGQDDVRLGKDEKSDKPGKPRSMMDMAKQIKDGDTEGEL